MLGTFTAEPGFLGYDHLPADYVFGGAVVPGTSTAVVAVDGGDLQLVDLDSGAVDNEFFASAGMPPSADAGLRPSVLRVSADSRFVVHMTTTASSKSCFDPQDPSGTDDRPCVAFSVYELASGRRVVGPIRPSFGAGDAPSARARSSLLPAATTVTSPCTAPQTAPCSAPRPARRTPDDPRVGDPLWNGHRARPAPRCTLGPDGAIYLGSLQGTIRVVDPGTVQVVRTVGGPPLSSNVNLALTADGLLVGTGRAAIVAIETSASATRRTCRHLQRNRCRSVSLPRVGRRTGRRAVLLRERLGSVRRTGPGDRPRHRRAIQHAARRAQRPRDRIDGRELVAFGRLPVVSRWRLDGSGAIVDHVAAGHNATGGYDSTGEMLLVAGRHVSPGDTAAVPYLSFDPAVWDPVADEPVDELTDGVFAAWFGGDLVERDLRR